MVVNSNMFLVFDNITVKYTIHFNSADSVSENGSQSNQNTEEDYDGPVVERKCPKCGNHKMSYATLQLRSADEGQTVFYTCTKCKYKESENS